MHEAKFLALSNDHVPEHDLAAIRSLSSGSRDEYDSYLKRVNDLVVQGHNLKETKSLERGLLLSDVSVHVDGVALELPVFLCSHIDNN